MYPLHTNFFRRCAVLLIVVFSFFFAPQYISNLFVSSGYAEEGVEDDSANATSELLPDAEFSQFFKTATLKVPIKTPPGRLGMAPKLNLVYNNYRGNGWIGVGWYLNLGAIQRSTKRGLDYTANDYVDTTNGSNDLVARTDWGTNYYGAKIEGKVTKYHYNGSGSGWEVTTRDGTKYYYGENSNSRQEFASGAKIFKWCLDKVQDVHGNYMTITYQQYQGEIYPDTISYTNNTGNTSANTGHSVRFILEDRNDIHPVYTTNYEVKTAKRLKTIEVYGNSSFQRRYVLNYDYSANSSRSRLISVIQYDRDNTRTLPPSTFGWQTGGAVGTFTETSFSATSWPTLGDNFKQFKGDINGDGRTDFMGVQNNGSNVRLYAAVSTGDGTYTLTYQDTTVAWDIDGKWFPGDINGDGRTDFMGVQNNSGYTRLITAISAGDGTYVLTYKDTTVTWDINTKWFPGDINGDGRTDFMGVQNNSGYTRLITVTSNSAASFNSDSLLQNANCTAVGSPTHTCSLNNAVYATQAACTAACASQIAICDRYSSLGGCPLGLQYACNWGVEPFTCTKPGGTCAQNITYSCTGDGGYDAPVSNDTTIVWDVDAKWFAGDINGDGRTDFMGAQNNNGYTRLITATLNSGAFFVTDPTYTCTQDNVAYSTQVACATACASQTATCTGGGHSSQGEYPCPLGSQYACNWGSSPPTCTKPGGVCTQNITYTYAGNGAYAITSQNTTVAWNADAKWFAGDINGDGRTDFMGAQNNGGYARLHSATSVGNGTYILTYQDTGWSMEYGISLFPGDVNGDGKTDFMAVQPADGYLRLLNGVSLGNGAYTLVPQTTSLTWDTNTTWLPGDINGDGKTDFMSFVWNGSFAGFYNYLSQSSLDLLINLTNSLGGHVAIAYTPSSTYPNVRLPFILQTVSSVAKDDGRGQILTDRYECSDGYYDYLEREFRGFGKVIATRMYDANTNSYETMTETWFHQDYTRRGLIQVQKTTSACVDTNVPCGQHRRWVNNTWSVNGTAVGISYPLLDRVVSTNTDVGADPYVYYVKYDYDNNLAVTKEHKCTILDQNYQGSNYVNDPTRCDVVSNDDMHTYYAYDDLIGPWILSRPKDIVVKDASNTNIVSRKWMDHNNNGQVTFEEICRSDSPASGCQARSTQNPVTSYTYNPADLGNVSSVTDPRGHTTTIAYDATKTFAQDTMKTINTPSDYKTTKIYDPGTGNLLTLIPPHLQGAASPYFSYQYDTFGRIIREERPDGGVTTYQYINQGSPTTQYIEKRDLITGGASAIDHYTYRYFDGLGRVYTTRSSGPDGKTIAIDVDFDNVGRTAWKSKPYFLGIETPLYTTFEYDGFSRLTATTFPDASQTLVAYQGLTRQTRDQNGRWTISLYDVYGRLKRTTDPDSTATEYAYDTLGNLIQVDAAVGRTEYNRTTMTYNSLSKKISMTDPDMGTWTYSHDKAGNLICQRDAKGQTIGFWYDSISRMTAKKYYANGIDCSNYLSATPTHTVTNTYDDPAIPYSKGMLTATLDPSSGEDKEDNVLAFDRMQRVTQSEKTTGTTTVTIGKTYDTAGRVYTQTYFPGAGNQKVYTYVYDPAGNTIGVWDNASTTYHVQYSNFTARGQQGLAVFPKPNGASVRTTYAYDPAMGRLTHLVTGSQTSQQQTVNCNTNTSYTCSLDNTAYTTQAACTTACAAQTATCTPESHYSICPLGSQYACDRRSTPPTCARPAGTCTQNVSYTCPLGNYACTGTPKQCTAPGTNVSTLQDLAYQFDPKGNITTLTDTANNITHTYTYDNLSRLLTATGTGSNPYAQSYAYDRIGNITNKSDVGNYHYNYGNTRPHAVQYTSNGLANITFQYDDNGNMTSKTVTQGPGTSLNNITWNEDNKPVTINVNGANVNFVYDGFGNRVKKTRGASTTYYFGDAYEKRGSVGIIHLFANGQRLASIRTDGNTQYYHGNHLGSASVITDQNGDVKQKIEYFPYGTYRYGTAPDQELGTHDDDGTFPNVNYTFTDQEDDDETGLYNYDARLYDPQLGRYISPDSIVPRPWDLQSFNRYSYCSNNPLVYTDPSGHGEADDGDCSYSSNFDGYNYGDSIDMGGVETTAEGGRGFFGAIADVIGAVVDYFGNNFFTDNTGPAFNGNFSSWTIMDYSKPGVFSQENTKSGLFSEGYLNLAAKDESLSSKYTGTRVMSDVEPSYTTTKDYGKPSGGKLSAYFNPSFDITILFGGGAAYAKGNGFSSHGTYGLGASFGFFTFSFMNEHPGTVTATCSINAFIGSWTFSFADKVNSAVGVSYSPGPGIGVYCSPVTPNDKKW
jgi:RHS repeat-associated protein